MFVGGFAFLVAAVGLFVVFMVDGNIPALIFAVIFALIAIDLFVFVYSHYRLSKKDTLWRKNAPRFVFHHPGEEPGDLLKAGYIVETLEDLVGLICSMKEIELTESQVNICDYDDPGRENPQSRAVTVPSYGFIGTLSKPFAA